MFVDQQGKLDSGLITEGTRILLISQAYCGQICSRIFEDVFFLAQLRDVLAAEDSTPVPEEHQNDGRVPPQRTKLYLPAINIRQNNSRESAGVIHGPIFYGIQEPLSQRQPSKKYQRKLAAA